MAKTATATAPIVETTIPVHTPDIAAIASHLAPPATPLVESTADRALRLKLEFESSRQTAIAELRVALHDIQQKLIELGDTVRTVRKAHAPCRVCGATDHDARHHRAENLARLKKSNRR